MEKESILTRPTPFASLEGKYSCLNTGKIHLEHTLDMEIAEVEVMCPLPQVDHLHTIAKLINGDGQLIDLESVIIEIDVLAFEQLYTAALGLKGATGHITALKTWFGLDNSLKMIPLFQPVCANFKSGKTYTVADNGKFYYYDKTAALGQKFKEYTSTFDLRKNYRDTIRIKHVGDTEYKGFIENDDTEAVIYPFQTIYTLMHDNPLADFVVFKNSIATTRSGVLKDQNAILLLAPKSSKSKAGGPEVFTGKYANRSHLCPPCAEISDFDLIPQ